MGRLILITRVPIAERRHIHIEPTSNLAYCVEQFACTHLSSAMKYPLLGGITRQYHKLIWEWRSEIYYQSYFYCCSYGFHKSLTVIQSSTNLCPCASRDDKTVSGPTFLIPYSVVLRGMCSNLLYSCSSDLIYTLSLNLYPIILSPWFYSTYRKYQRPCLCH